MSSVPNPKSPLDLARENCPAEGTRWQGVGTKAYFEFVDGKVWFCNRYGRTASPTAIAWLDANRGPRILPPAPAPLRFVDRVDRREDSQASHLTDKGTDRVAEEIIHAGAAKLLQRFDESERDTAEISPEAQARYAKKIAASVEFWSDSQNAAKRIMGLYVHALLYASPTAPVLLICAGLLNGGEIEVECVEDYLRIKRIKAPATTRNNDTFDLGDGMGLPVGDGPSAPLAAHNGVESDLLSEGGASNE